MGKMLKYLRMRALSTKDTRQLRQSDVSSARRYNNVLDLSSVSLGSCLSVGCLVVVGQVAKTTAGPAVTIATLLAAVVTLLVSVNYAELQSRLPRVPGSTYEQLFYVAGELCAFVLLWCDTAASLLYCCTITRVLSANIDVISGGLIHNVTVAATGGILPGHTYMDLLGFVLVLLFILYLALGGSTTYVAGTAFHTLCNFAVLVILVFTGIVGAFHFNFQLWSPANYFQYGFIGIVRGAAMILSILLSQKLCLSLCDFMWLGIKPTVLGSMTLSALTSLLAYLAVGGLVSLLSQVDSWTGDAVLATAFQHAGVVWVVYVIGAASLLVLVPQAVLYLLKAIESVKTLCCDDLLHSLMATVWSEGSVPLGALLTLGILTALLTLLCPIDLILRILSILILLEALFIACVVMVMRSKPPPQQQLTCWSAPHAETPLTENTEETATDTYGSVPHSSNSAVQHSTAAHRDSDDDIDIVVEEYRIKRAAAQCYRDVVVHSTPTTSTLRRTTIATVLFVLFILLASLILVHASDQVVAADTSVIVILVFSVIGALITMVTIIVQPRDKILPKTFLIQLPAQPWASMVTVVMVTVLLASMEIVEWLVILGWIALGLMYYASHVTLSHDNTYREFNNSALQGHGHMDAEDIHQLATFVPNNRPSSQPDDTILVP